MESTTSDTMPPANKRKSANFDVEFDINKEASSDSAMMKSIAAVLTEIVNESDAEIAKMVKNNIPLPKENKLGIAFSAKRPPAISILGYFARIVKYTHIEDSTIIISLIFIDRLCELNNIQLNKNNIHRLILSGVLLAIKYNEDDYYSNIFYGKVGGVSLKEINVLELEFLKLLQYCLFVKKDIYKKYKEYLVNHK